MRLCIDRPAAIRHCATWLEHRPCHRHDQAELAKGGFEEGTPSEEGDVDIVRVMGTWLQMLTCCRAEMATTGGVDLSAKGFREEVTEEKGLDAMEAEEQREW
jgi:hypothetical protein